MADPLKTARRMFDEFLSRADPASTPGHDPNAKDKKAQELGKKGGLKGGKSRAKKLSAERRSQIAAKAAQSRWAKEREWTPL